MSTPYRQDTRIGELFTPLGEDKLVLVEFSGTEGMSELFQFDISAICDEQDDGPLNFDDALGQTCSLRVKTFNDGERFFSGTLVEAARKGPAVGGALYQLVLRPWFWLLTQRVNSRVFHDMTPEDVIETVLGEYGFADRQNRASSTNVKLEYCVQHRESDFAFVSRLLERHGIAYHFEFEKDKQTMVLANSQSGYRQAAGGSRDYLPDEDGGHTDEEHLFSWAAQRQFVSGKVALNDYDYKEPNADLVAERQGGARYTPSDLEVYRHPGQYLKPGHGDDYAAAAMDSLQARDNHYLAEGNCIGLSPGMTFKLQKHADAGEYLVLKSSHHLVSENYRSGSGGGGSAYYGRNELVAADRPYAPPQVTPRPFIAGPQTATVITDPGEDPEKYGRVKVKFHWDKSGSAGDSMYCRVAQVWAGSEWGGQFIPRIDMEVLVQFIDGDPDRPVIVGTVPNDKNRHPFKEEDTSGWRTQSLGSGYNELAFVDTAGDELIRMLGEKDILIEAKNQITLKVGGSTIVMDGSSITMKSTTITIEASSTLTTESKGNATHKAAADLTTESSGTANHKASAVMVIQGALVKIN